MMLAFSKYYSFLLLLAALVLQQTGGRLTAESEEPPQSEEPPRKTQEAPFQLDEPTYFGSGCLPGTIVVVPAELGGETTTVSVLFSDYIAATDGSTLRVRKTCNLALPVHVAPGLSVGIFQVDYRGNAYVPSSFASPKPYASFNAEYFFANQRGPIKRRTYTGGLTQALDKEFFETDTVGAIAWSECGGSTNFRINTSLLAMKRNRNDQDVVISMDTADIDQDGFYFEFRSRQC
jgi:Domain of unknown function (DUF4360)